MEDKRTLFVDVILPLALPKTYSYRVPFELSEYVQVGVRVVVQFGKSKLYSALVLNVHQKAPSQYQAKYIDSVLDEAPVVNNFQFKLWNWISEYYMCHLGEVMNAAMPAGLKLNSETRIVLHPDYQSTTVNLTDKEYLVTDALQIQEILTIQEISEILNIKHVYPVVKSLIQKGVAQAQEELKQGYRPKVVEYVSLSTEMQNEDTLKNTFNELQKAPKQLELLMKFIQLSNHFGAYDKQVKKIALQKSVGVTSSVVNQLCKKGILSIYKEEEGRLSHANIDDKFDYQLSEIQEDKYSEINNQFKNKDVVLLHGVTSSGKTEVYIKLMKEAIERGDQVLYLLPEIALTTQIINRLQKRFGDKVGIYHSRFNQNERVEVWKNVIDREKYQIVLGARSSLFLPFENLGLIIIDEEHETSFKQHEPAPRYNARDAAIVLAKLHNAKVLLGSATPSIETYRNALEGKYGLVEMKERFGNVQLPEILVSDIAQDTKKKKMKANLGELLYTSIDEALKADEQVILFQNRRGFSPFIQCDSCAWVPQCKNCDVSLTYHKYRNEYNCHYCGYKMANIESCKACGSFEISLKGFGTEKIEEDIKQFFPKAKVQRMDLDTTRKKDSYRQIISQFEERAIDILVGTQMVTKGLDFDNVALAGVLSADQMLNFADFRAFERSYQLMAQVAGRAGRKKKRGKVIIQTRDPYHAIIRDVIDNNYENMYKNELLDRRSFHYPPFHRLIKFTLRYREINELNDAALYFANMLKAKFGNRVLGPEFPAIARVRNQYNKNVLLKIEKDASIKTAKQVIRQMLIEMATHKNFKKIRVIVDVDPI
ncbi:MAG: primosomal protein N' [Flavobacteriales bacterium]|nr:primosomal protein N' [Flavobacteriales bacterium]